MAAVRGRRRVVGMLVGGAFGFGLGLQLIAPPDVAADIYKRVDRFGVIHYTNVPTDKRFYRVVIREMPSISALAGYRVQRSPLRAESRAYDPIIANVSRQYNVEQALVKAVIKAESSFNRTAVSPKGALGLMQLMPATARMHGVRRPFTPDENIEGGCRHLRMLHDRYRGNIPLIVAAYNAGEKRVDDARGVPNIAETREYLARVLRYRLAYLREGAGVQQARSN